MLLILSLSTNINISLYTKEETDYDKKAAMKNYKSELDNKLRPNKVQRKEGLYKWILESEDVLQRMPMTTLHLISNN